MTNKMNLEHSNEWRSQIFDTQRVWLSRSILALIILCILLTLSLTADLLLIPWIKVVSYDPNNVTLIKAHYGFETEILFDDNETVQNVSIGDSMAWQAVPVTNHLFIKPTATSITNMTVLTNQRSYNFELNSSNSDNPNNQIYELKFIYPEVVASSLSQSAQNSLQNNTVIPPTLHINQGAVIMVFVVRDLKFNNYL